MAAKASKKAKKVTKKASTKRVGAKSAKPPSGNGKSASLLIDHRTRREIADAGRGLVESRYSWAQVARPFEHHCETAVDAYARATEVTERRSHLSPVRSTR